MGACSDDDGGGVDGGGASRGAVTEIEAALETGSQDPLIRYHAAEISAAIGDRDAAIEHLEIVLATNPRVAAIHVDDVENLADELGLQMPPPAVG